MNTKALGIGMALALCAGASLEALAQVKPETQVAFRLSAMRLQGKYFYSILPMAQGKIPYDAAIVTRNTGYLEVLTKMAWDNFDPATKDIKSRTLPEAYSEPAKFKAAQDTLATEMAKLAAVVKGGNEAATKAAIIDVGKACDSCHDNFRQMQQ